MTIRNTVRLSRGILVIAFIAASAQAKPPYSPDLVTGGNLWKITAFNDASLVHTQWATQGLCFYATGVNGSHQQYVWVSNTFPNWNGRAVQEGDQIFMHGDYAEDVGHDGITWEITTDSAKNIGFGHWHEWREDGRVGRTIGFANARLERAGRCAYDRWEEAYERYYRMEYRANEEGELMVTPYGFTEKDLADQE